LSQAVTAIIGNGTMSRVFTATGADNAYSNLNDSVTATNLGLTMPGQTINYICGTMTEGVAIGRIISSQSNTIYRQFVCSKVGYVDAAECRIQPLVIQPDMLLQIYSMPLDASALESNVLGLITTNRGVEAFIAQNSIDNSNTEFVSLLSSLGVGDLLFGATMSRIQVAVESGGFLTSAIVVDASGGTQWTGYGNAKLPTAGGTSTQMNGDFMVSIPLKKGFKLNLNTVTA
jgi:hypothetical protein